MFDVHAGLRQYTVALNLVALTHPVEIISPTTCSLAAGVVVPMPTLPVEIVLAVVLKFVPKIKPPMFKKLEVVVEGVQAL